jgi:NADPH-dependent glutamate synthase beta subunit-like oxidoreductase/glutamate synthase domain-containing protein 3/Pyruvate/2-oxoacid:ferredoxin oxidoreductase delta subunit
VTSCTIDVGTMHYRELNSLIRDRILEGCSEISLEHVTGQRYIGAGLERGVRIRIKGIPGQDLGVFMGGAEIEVQGNAQDGVGNTMNDGALIIHGSVGDIPGHMMRNGRIFIRGRAGFRAGIMMKEYQTSHPVMVIGETAGDYLGEYMAGGTIVVLGLGCQPGKSPVDMHVASGIFGGTIFVRGGLEPWQLGGGALMSRATTADMERIVVHIDDFCRSFILDKAAVLDAPFSVIRAAGERPYGKLYVHGNKTSRGLKPVHRNLTPPCAEACPIGIPNPVIIRKIREGAVAEALELIDEYTPFRFSCCGIVCPGLCRAACTRNILDEPVRIDEIARRYAPAQPPEPSRGVERDETIAVIGAGPAGLSAAWQLARRGYSVEVYEKEPDIGGKLTHNIPAERLAPADVERDLARIRAMGIQFHAGAAVDKVLFAKLQKRHAAVIVAVGAQKPRMLGFPGEQNGVSSFEFLRSLREGNRQWDLLGKQVLVVGAGNVAMDAAAECFRLGAAGVTAVDVRKPLAFGKELDKAKALGTKIVWPRAIEGWAGGKATFKGEAPLAADFLIVAVGEVPELSFAGGSIVVSKDAFTTNLPMVYACGDAVAPGLVTHSIAAGRRVAETIHRTLRGIPEPAGQAEAVAKARMQLAYFPKAGELNDSLEACFSCGTCVQCDICVENCPRGAITRRGESFTVALDICTGCGVCEAVCPRGAIVMAKRQGQGGRN